MEQLTGISGLMTALAEYVGDVMVNDALVPAPDRVLRYLANLPADCCTEAGALGVSWSNGVISTKFPASASSQQDPLCSGKLVTTISIRWMRCWPAPPFDEEQGVQFTDEFYAGCDAVSAAMTDVGEIVARALGRLECAVITTETDPFVQAVVEAVAPRGWLRLLDYAPIVPSGMCAGVQWRLYAAATPLVLPTS